MKVLPLSSGAKGPQTSTVTEEFSELFSVISVILLSLVWKKVTNIDNKYNYVIYQAGGLYGKKLAKALS